MTTLPYGGPSATGRTPTPTPPPPPLLDIESLAERLGVSSRHVRRLVDAGKIPSPVRLGACCRWSRDVVEAWIAEGCPSCRARKGGAA